MEPPLLLPAALQLKTDIPALLDSYSDIGLLDKEGGTMNTMYRRRMSGRGKRTGAKKHASGPVSREYCRLFQLLASAALFALVFFGRGVFPQQAALWNRILNSSTDLKRVMSAIESTVAEGGSLWDVVDFFKEDLETPNEEQTSHPSAEEVTFPAMIPYFYRAYVPGFGARPLLTQSVGGAAEVPAGHENTEQLVTAAAQEYSDTGEALPANVSFQYYELGLEKTTAPVSGSVTSAFGFRDHPVDGEYSFHAAVDIGVKKGTDVLAFGDGCVRYIGENDVFGLYVKIDHDNGVSTFYAHCEELLVRKGQTLKCGDVIAKSGETGNATGPHLHFSIEKDGIRLDPLLYLDMD